MVRMKNKLTKIVLAITFGLVPCFAQAVPEKLAVYVSGASDVGINKSLGNKLLVAMSQSGEYAGIADHGSFQDELASGKVDIFQVANHHGADYVCIVSMTEVFGAYSITAHLVRTAGSQVVKIGSTDHAIKSLEDLTVVSNELASQLLQSGNQTLPPPVSAVEQKRCDRTYNINELIFKIKDGFPKQLKDCSSTLAKDMLNPFGKKLEPKSFMMQCPVDGIKKELPDGFPNADKIIGSLTKFVQGLLGSAMAGGALDPKKLVSAVGNMNIEELLSDVKKLAAVECVVDEPYEPPVVPAEESDSGEEKDKSRVSFGIRAGINFSHICRHETVSEVYCIDNILGGQFGFVLDIEVSEWFYIQPGLMYIAKGFSWESIDGSSSDGYLNNLELPLLLSLKFSVFRLNAGPYFGVGIVDKHDIDFGLIASTGFDIGKFYIGVFYDYGLTEVSDYRYSFYTRTLGFNVGVNL
jgi:hypothetical protein